MNRLMASVAVLAMVAAPAAAQQDRTAPQGTTTQMQQQGTQQQRTEGTTGQQEGMSRQARACMERLEEIDRQLGDAGYGRLGPGGYGIYGDRYAQTGAAPADTPEPAGVTRGAAGAFGDGGMATPRSDMRALMRAGYVMAVHGYDEGCDAVVHTVQDIGTRYEETIRSGDFDQEGLERWRGEFLSAAVPVNELERPLRADRILGADVQNMRDESLGDIDDVVLGPNGEIQYVILTTGGFLGMGEDEIPVRWTDLRKTVEPNDTTFVLDVDKEVFDSAPRIDAEGAESMAAGERSNRIEEFWEQHRAGRKG